MTLTAKGRLTCAGLLGTDGLVAVEFANRDPLRSAVKFNAYDGQGRYICNDSGSFDDPFRYADSFLDMYVDRTLAAVFFDPKAEECPPVLRDTDGVVFSGDWQTYAIARFQFEQAEKDRQEKREHERAKGQLKKQFSRALRALGIPADEACVTLHDTTFTDKENPGSLPEYLPAFDIEGMTFVHTLGDRERLVGLLNTPADIALATERLDTDMRILTTPADLGAALAMNGGSAK